MKKRPAVVINAPHPSIDLLLPLTSQTHDLQPGEFILQDWQAGGLLFPSAVKRGLFTLDRVHVIRRLGHLSRFDMEKLEQTLRGWLGL